MIPEQIKQRISELGADYATVPTFSGGDQLDEKRRVHYIAGAMVGYSLSSKRIEELEYDLSDAFADSIDDDKSHLS